jgi:hypothetical protein
LPDTFDLELPFGLSGDQPQAIRELTEGVQREATCSSRSADRGEKRTIVVANVR